MQAKLNYNYLQINELSGITSKWTNKTADDEQVVDCHKKCIEYQHKVDDLIKRAKQLELVSEILQNLGIQSKVCVV